MRYIVKNPIYSFLIISLLFCIVVAVKPVTINSSIYDLIPNETRNNIPDAVQKKLSSQLNIIIESQDFYKAKTFADNFYNTLLEKNIENISYNAPTSNMEAVKNYIKQYQYSFLSETDRQNIINDNINKITEESIAYISSSLLPAIISLEDDPFSLIPKYADFLLKNNVKWQEKEGVLYQFSNKKYYILLNIEIDANNINKANQVIETITGSYNNDSGIVIHFSGVPFHTYQMYKKSKVEIALISVASLISIIVLSFLLLKKIQYVLIVFFNLAVGFLFGTIVLFMFFDKVHLLSFAFGSSLIGICIDYSFHKLYASRRSKVLKKSVLHSFLTTICCFIPLIFSDIPLLKQIAVFTLGGLIGTFIWVFFIADYNTKNASFYCAEKLFFLTKKKKIIILGLLLLCIIYGLFPLSIHTNITDLYKPDENLMKDDQLFYSLNGSSSSSILLIKGSTLQNALETEEFLRTHYNILGLSYFLPSIKTQKSNYNLIKKLYDVEALHIKQELGLNKKPNISLQKTLTENNFISIFGNNFYQKFVIKDRDAVWLISTTNTEINELPHNVFLFSPAKTLNMSLRKYTHNAVHSLIIGFIFLSLIIFYFYRQKSFLYLLPSLFSIIGTLSIINAFYGSVSFFHVLSLFIVTGLSIDYTVFHLNAINTNFKPVLFSFLSSFIGFGLLSFISFNIIAIMGQTIAIGLAISYIISLILANSDIR